MVRLDKEAAEQLLRGKSPREIYDIVRERGWLVLELMQGSLTQIQNGAPIDLNVMKARYQAIPAVRHDLERIGIRRVFTPSDYKLTEIVGALVGLCES